MTINDTIAQQIYVPLQKQVETIHTQLKNIPWPKIKFLQPYLFKLKAFQEPLLIHGSGGNQVNPSIPLKRAAKRIHKFLTHDKYL